MNGKIWSWVLLCAVLGLSGCATKEPELRGGVRLLHASDGPEPIRTPEELVAAINVEMKRMKRATFTREELTVWLASQASLGVDGGALRPRVEPFLRSMIAGKPFRDPVELCYTSSNCIPLSEDHSGTGKRLFLPPNKYFVSPHSQSTAGWAYPDEGHLEQYRGGIRIGEGMSNERWRLMGDEHTALGLAIVKRSLALVGA